MSLAASSRTSNLRRERSEVRYGWRYNPDAGTTSGERYDGERPREEAPAVLYGLLTPADVAALSRRQRKHARELARRLERSRLEAERIPLPMMDDYQPTRGNVIINETVTDAHPTAEEWERRQQGGPPEFAALMADVRARRDGRDAEAAARERARDKMIFNRRMAFAGGLRDILAADGLAFLADHVAEWKPHEHSRAWCPDTTLVTATIDAGRYGLWPIDVTFQAGHDSGTDALVFWVPRSAGGFWTVRRPDHPERHFHTVLDAIEEAASYAPTPF